MRGVGEIYDFGRAVRFIGDNFLDGVLQPGRSSTLREDGHGGKVGWWGLVVSRGEVDYGCCAMLVGRDIHVRM